MTLHDTLFSTVHNDIHDYWTNSIKKLFFFQIEQQMDALHKQKAAQYKKTAEVSLLLRPKHTQELCTVCILPCIMAVAIIGG